MGARHVNGDRGPELQGALERLYARRRFGIKPGLEVEQSMLARLGNPERAFAPIHIAGTNGKGSVAALLESVLRASGFRTGLYTSPHLVRFNERFVINGAEVGDVELADMVGRVERAAAEVAKELGREPTFFECATAMAFDCFAARGVRLAVVETGMGGRLDATNVVMPVVSVITRIDIEHTSYLGKDIESIAAEKCGIIKPGRPVVCGSMPEAALATARRIAREREAPLTSSSDAVSVGLVERTLKGQKVRVESTAGSYGTLLLPLQGEHQLENLATAVAAVECVGRAVGIEPERLAVRAGVEAVRWPGRFQLMSSEPPVVLDGAHNPGAATVLAATLRAVFRKKPVGLVLGMCGDKDLEGFLKPFLPVLKRVWAVPIKNERGRTPAEIRELAGRLGVESTVNDVATACREARAWAGASDGVVCIAGSLFLVGEVLERQAELAGG